MTILAKYLNSGNRLTAFSLIEILTVLLIVGVILTIPNWPSLGTNLLNRIEGRVYATQAKIDLAILAQSRPSSQKFITVKLEPFCPSKVVQIHLGGLVKPVSIEFWQGRPNRLHDRIRYRLQKDFSWKIERLAP